jgi:KTSC domain
MTCKHKHGRKYVVSAEKIEVRCAADDCKELLHERTRVLSSHIYAIGRSGKNTEVMFMDYKTKGPGSAVIYYDVPKSLHDALMNSVSKGEFFDARIKDKFDWNYIRGEDGGHKKKTRRQHVEEEE